MTFWEIQDKNKRHAKFLAHAYAVCILWILFQRFSKTKAAK